MGRLWCAALIVVSSIGPAFGASLDANTIEQHMKAALEPPQPSLRRIDVVMHAPLGDPPPWMARQARKQLADGNRILTVLLTPDSVRGVALLVWERPNKPLQQWFYLPAIRRVRQISPASSYESFLNTDFSYYDLGFVDLRSRGFTLLGTDTHAGVPAYKVEEVPRNQWYFSRIVAWIAQGSFLPLERDFYDMTKALWKVERFQDITVIDGVATPLRIVMEDKAQNTSTELRVSSVRYDAQIPDEVFDPDKLPEVINHPLWSIPLEPKDN